MRLVKLVWFVTVGAAIGIIATPFIVAALFSYDHGRGERETVALVSSVIGVLIASMYYWRSERKVKKLGR